jgi:hypothetical protein
VPLRDDPAILRGPLGFAIRVNRSTSDEELAAARKRIPGLLMFARTFAGQLLEEEFGVSLAGFPIPARTRAAALSARLKREPDAAAARRLVMAIVDLCDRDSRSLSGAATTPRSNWTWM